MNKYFYLLNVFIHRLLKTLKYKYCSKFRTCSKLNIIYRPGIFNLETRTITVPGQKELLSKVDGG